jgi:hypothetical protein
MFRYLLPAAAVLVLLAAPPRAHAIGCISGGVAGAVAGHMAHHGVLGAIGGCIAGHEYHKHEKRDAERRRDPEERSDQQGYR